MDSFLLIAKDKPNSLTLRLDTRPEHIAYIENSPSMVLMGGPITNEFGEMCGTMLVYNTTNLSVARSFLENDPYSKVGLFETAELLPFKWTVNQLVKVG